MKEAIFTSEELAVLHKLINRELEHEESERLRLAPARAFAKQREDEVQEAARLRAEGAKIFGKSRHGEIRDNYGCCCDDCLAARPRYSEMTNER